MTRTRRGFLSTLAGAGVLRATSPTNWPSFRGADSRGVSDDDPRLPSSWSRTENVAWRTPSPGFGWGSPVVWGDRVYSTTVVVEGEIEPIKKGLYGGGNRLELPKQIHRWLVRALDFATGETVWEREVHRGAPETPRHLKNSYASETPIVDGERVYAHFGHLGTYCFTLEGRPEWSKSWPPYPVRNGWGTASSLVVHEGRLYIVNDNEEESYLVALDKRTGQEIWRAPREEGSNWSTPFVWKNERRTEIVTTGTNKVRSYDLDGKLLWELSKMSSIVVPTPFTDGGLLYVTSGYVGDDVRPVYAVRPGASGDVSLGAGETANEFIAWSLPQGGPYNPSPLVYRDLYYTLYDRGFLTCHDARTGREIYDKQRFEVGASAFTASPWAYNGRVFCLSEDGDCFVVQTGPEYKLLGKNSLGELSMATPAIARGSLIIRTAEAFYRVASERT